MANKQAAKLIRENLCGVDTVKFSPKNGWIECQRGYFYRHGQSEENLASLVLGFLPEARLVDKGDHWAAWPKRSYFWVRISVENI